MQPPQPTGVWASSRNMTPKLRRAAFLFFLVKGVAWLALPRALVRFGWS